MLCHRAEEPLRHVGAVEEPLRLTHRLTHPQPHPGVSDLVPELFRAMPFRVALLGGSAHRQQRGPLVGAHRLHHHAPGDELVGLLKHEDRLVGQGGPEVDRYGDVHDDLPAIDEREPRAIAAKLLHDGEARFGVPEVEAGAGHRELRLSDARRVVEALELREC